MRDSARYQSSLKQVWAAAQRNLENNTGGYHARLLDIENLRTTFDIHVGKVQAVRGVNLHVDEGETVGVVGESGCGKSVSMLSVLHLLPDYAKISADKMIFDGTDLTRLTPKMFRKISGDQIGMIFQDPMTSLNPLFTVGDQLTEPLRIHKGISKKKRATSCSKSSGWSRFPIRRAA